MPKRLAVGNPLVLFAFSVAKCVVAVSRSTRSRTRSRRTIIEALEDRTLLSTTYFVSPSGSNSGPGTIAQPFKTIQEAANVANWGDTVDIETGTYRETVRPAHSGVTFTNYDGQSVTVSGANVVSGWSSAGGNIYKTSLSSNLGDGNNQVFVDGQMVNEARWPNAGPNISNPTDATVGSYSNGVIYDHNVTQGNGYWDGADITIIPGDGWVAYTGVVENSGPGWLQVSLPSLSGYEVPTAGNSYYLTGKYQALTASNEFYIDSSNNLYLWDPNSDNPASHTVEVKERQYAFDLTGTSNTTIKGINIFAATIHTDSGSTNTTLNGISAKYITQFNNIWGSGWSPPGADGIELDGSNSIIENSTIAYSAGDGIYVGASNVRVTNNLIHDVDYSATDAAGVRIGGANAEVDHNTIYNCGRDGINIQAAPVQVLNNVVHDFMLQTYDGSGIYTVSRNGQGSQIAYNTIYDAHKNNYQGLDAVGIMLDNNSSNYVVHDNTTSNVDAGFKANDTSYDEQVYNNHFGAIQHAIETNGWTGYAYNWSGSQVYNNVYYNSSVELGSNVSQWSNSYASGSPALNTSVTNPTYVPAPTSTPATSTSTTSSNHSGASSTTTSSSSSSSSSTTSGSSRTSTSPPAPSTATTTATSSTGTNTPQTSAASGTPSASVSSTPTPSSGSNSALSTTAVDAAVLSESAVVEPAIGPRVRHATVTLPAAVTSVTAMQLSGTVAGTFRLSPKTARNAARYSIAALGVSLPGLGKFNLSGAGIGAIVDGDATGTVHLRGAKGTITLALTASNVTIFDPTPTSYAFTVKSATGSYKGFAGSGGAIDLVFTPNPNGRSGTFSLILAGSAVA